MDTLDAMRAFVKVVEHSSFTRAADGLRLPPGSVTKLVQNLEAHLQTKLLNRTTRRVTVTPDGAAYFEQAVRLLGELEELESGMRGAKANPRGRLRVDVVAWVGEKVVVPALADFYEKYPDIQIELGATDREVDLLTENIDCAIRGGTIDNESLVARKIADFHFIAAAAPEYLRRHGTPSVPTDLEQEPHRLVGFFSSRTGKLRPQLFRGEAGEFQVLGKHVLAVNDTNTYIAAGISGMGVVCAPRFILRHALEDGSLVEILHSWRSPPVPMHVVWAPNRHLSAKLRVFVDWLAELFKQHELLTVP